VIYIKNSIHCWSYLTQFFRMRNTSSKFVEENQNIYFLLNKVLQNSCHSWHNVEKHCRVGQATDDTMGHAHCMLGNKPYKHTLWTCYTFCFSTSKQGYTNASHCYVLVHCLCCVFRSDHITCRTLDTTLHFVNVFGYNFFLFNSLISNQNTKYSIS
jgi:hypothetical protein